MIFRKCDSCGDVLPYFFFGKARRNRTHKKNGEPRGVKPGTWGLKAKCKPCMKKHWHEWFNGGGYKKVIPNKKEYREKRREDWAERLLVNRRQSLSHSVLHELYRNQEGRCYWSGLPMNVAARKKGESFDPYSITLDRLNPGGEYSKDNVVLACSAMNLGRSNCPADEWEAFLVVLRGSLNNQPELLPNI
jgi:hypothetical protein